MRERRRRVAGDRRAAIFTSRLSNRGNFMTTTDDQHRLAAARAYWTGQMELAFDFMEMMRFYPLKESGEAMVSIPDALDGLKVEYSSSPTDNRYPQIYFIRIGLRQSLRRVAQEMNDRGWILKIEDGYRSPAMQRAKSQAPGIFDAILRKVMWELDGTVPTTEFMLRRLSVLVATRCRVGTHVSGSAIDISVIDQTTGTEIGRGGSYLEISERTPFDSPFVTPEERRHRNEIAAVFRRHSWFAYPFEFWHFSGGDSYAEYLAGSGSAARYGPIVFENGTTVAMSAAESDALLEPLEIYRSRIATALARIKT